MELLSEEEAWKLFRETVGEVVDSHSIQRPANCVIKECDGLPLAIIVVGAYLRKEESIHIWENAVKELSSPETYDTVDVEEKSI